MYEEILDVSALPCPMPIIKLKQKLTQWHCEGVTGQIRLLVSDKGALKDIPAFCQQQGLLLVEVREGCVPMEFVIRSEA